MVVFHRRNYSNYSINENKYFDLVALIFRPIVCLKIKRKITKRNTCYIYSKDNSKKINLNQNKNGRIEMRSEEKCPSAVDRMALLSFFSPLLPFLFALALGARMWPESVMQ